MSHYLYRLARWCFRKRKLVLTAWIVVIVAVMAGAQISGGKTNNAFTLPGTESGNVITILEHKLPKASGATTTVVVAAKQGTVTTAQNEAAIKAMIAQLKKMPQVAQVTDPFLTKSVSPDKAVALVTVYYTTSSVGAVKQSTIDKLRPSVKAAESAGMQVEFTGEVYPYSKLNNTPEAIGVVVALGILMFTFGSLLAGGMPIIAALLGVIFSMMAILIVASMVSVAETATTISTMLGLACGIDYSLFIFTRYRQHVIAGDEMEEAAGFAAGTAGGSVVFAALSVMIALAGLSLIGLPFLTVMGLAGAGTIFVTLMIALTLLPAVFGFAGHRAARFSNWKIFARAKRAAEAAVHTPEKTAGTRWEAFVSRHHAIVLVVGVSALLVLSIPVLSMNLGLPGANSEPHTTTERRAYDLTTEHFGAGYNAVLTVLAEHVTTPVQAEQIAKQLDSVPNVAGTSVGVVTNGIALVDVVPKTGPTDSATKQLVHYIRDHRAALAAGTGAYLMVGGQTAVDIDISAKLGSALPEFLIVVVGLAFILLSIAFRTFWVPLKSIVGFLLSIGAALGAQVAVFQWGWFSSISGATKAPTLSFLPILLLAIIFGLSSDYEVFVVSRIKEYHTKHADARSAVVMGAGQSARVVTAAALIMAAVFGSFMLAPDPMVKAIGLSFSLGVLLDAFVVRLTLVPAFMSIVGERIWSRPKFFDKIPDPDIEGYQLEQKIGSGSSLHSAETLGVAPTVATEEA